MKDKARRAYLKHCDKSLLDCFSECAQNILKNNVPLKKRQFDVLKRNRKNVRALAHKGTSLKRKRRIVQQRGGFLSALLVPAITALGSILASRFIPQHSA